MIVREEPDEAALLWFVAGGGLWLAWFLVVARRGQSPGKQILRTRVVRADGATSGLFRTLARRELLFAALLLGLAVALDVPSLAICFFVFALGGLWCLVDVNTQCLWDKLARTYVVSIEGYARQQAWGAPPRPDTSRMEKLANLREEGVITEEEYAEQAHERGGR